MNQLLEELRQIQAHMETLSIELEDLIARSEFLAERQGIPDEKNSSHRR